MAGEKESGEVESRGHGAGSIESIEKERWGGEAYLRESLL